MKTYSFIDCEWVALKTYKGVEWLSKSIVKNNQAGAYSMQHTTSMILVSIPYRLYENSVYQFDPDPIKIWTNGAFEMTHPKRKTDRSNTLFKMNSI